MKLPRPQVLFGGKGLRRPDVIEDETRMIGDDRFGRHASAELAQYHLNRDAGSPDHRLSAHDLRIEFDPITCHGLIC